MACLVCGFDADGAVCARCGTDLRALEGRDGEARLEIRPVVKPKATHAGAPTPEAF